MNTTNTQTAQHTPGPWRVDSFDGPQQYAEILAGDGVQDTIRICDIPSWPCATEEMEANANLIASSPDLFCAAELAIPCLEFMAIITNADIEKTHNLRCLNAIRQLRQAIAKATGKAVS